jgi:hypothetical protein
VIQGSVPPVLKRFPQKEFQVDVGNSELGTTLHKPVSSTSRPVARRAGGVGRCSKSLAARAVPRAIPQDANSGAAASKAVAFKPPEAIGPKLARWQRLRLRGVGLGYQQARSLSVLLELNGGTRFRDWPGKQHSVFAGWRTARRARCRRGLGFHALLRWWRRRHGARELLDGHGAIWRGRRLGQACDRHVGLSCWRR